MWKSLRDWWRAEGDLIHLQGLDDRLLADIGVEREELRAEVMGRAGATFARDGSEPCDCRPRVC